MREVRMRGGEAAGEGAGEGNDQQAGGRAAGGRAARRTAERLTGQAGGVRIVDKRWGNLTTNRKLSPLPKKMLFCLMLCCHIAIGKLQFQVGKNGLNGIRVIFGGEAKT